jgi:Ni/Co efflux regulator RcnB
MKKLITTIACLTMLGSSMALAQDSTRNAPPAAVKRSQQGDQPRPAIEAPIGHRQPRPGDLPPETGANDPGKITAQDRELDRMIKGICKGC